MPALGGQCAQRPLCTRLVPAFAGHEVGSACHPVAARARRPRGLSAGAPCPAMCARMPDAVGGWLAPAPCRAQQQFTMDDIVQTSHGQVAQRAGLLRLAGAGRARPTGIMRDDRCPGSRARLPDGCHRLPRARRLQARETDRRSSSATTRPTTSGRWFFQNGPQRVFVELEVNALGLARGRQTGAVTVPHRRPSADCSRRCLTDERGLALPPHRISAWAWSTRRTLGRAAQVLEQGAVATAGGLSCGAELANPLAALPTCPAQAHGAEPETLLECLSGLIGCWRKNTGRTPDPAL